MGLVRYELDSCELPWRRSFCEVTSQGEQCVMVPGGRSGWISGKVRGYGADYFGLP